MSRADRISTMAANGGPPRDAAVLYAGEVMHQRLRPFGHRFAYRVFSLLVDLDRLEELDRRSSLFSVNRRNVFSFDDADHAELPGETARAYAGRLLAQAGLVETPARILLLCYPRMLGYVFNPISVYFAYRADDELLAVIYAVRNTFGERHSYVARVEPGEVSASGLRQTRAKSLHVSPFMTMAARYHFRVLPPGKAVRLRIHETEGDAPTLAATFSGEIRPLDSPALARCLLQFPLLTWKIMAGIHWEALKLWLKGARFFTSPRPGPTASIRDDAKLQAGE